MKVNRRFFYSIALVVFTIFIFFVLDHTYLIGYFTGQPIPFPEAGLGLYFLGDSITYSQQCDWPLDAIFQGVVGGEVSMGTVMNILGITGLTSMFCMINIPPAIGFIVLNLSLFYVISKTFKISNNAFFLAMLVYPFTWSHLLSINKEIFTIAFILVANYLSYSATKVVVASAFFAVIREVYLLTSFIYIIFGKLKNIFRKFRFSSGIAVYLISIFLSSIIPASYFEETRWVEEQGSGFLQIISLELMANPFTFILGVAVKVAIGFFAPLFPSVFIKNIGLFNYFGVALAINSLLVFIFMYFYIMRSSFRSFIRTNHLFLFRIIFFTTIVFSLAPGAPARFLSPIVFIINGVMLDYLIGRRSSYSSPRQEFGF